MGAEIQVDNFTITNQVECMRWRARKTIWKYTLEMRWAIYKYKYTLVRNEMAAKWGRGGGRIGKIGGMGTVDN